MAFVSAMSSDYKTGVNGATVYTEKGAGDRRVALFTMLNRGLEKEYIQTSIREILKQDSSDETLLDLFLMAFHTRDVRGGKGEKELFYEMMTALYSHAPEKTQMLCWLVPHYGCWRDMWALILHEPNLGYTIFPAVCRQFLEDLGKASVGRSSELSLLAKWLPREKSKTFPSIAYRIAEVLYHNETCKKKRMMLYRKETSFLNHTLQTAEIDMCGGTWRKITPSHLPGRCLKIHRKALLNEALDHISKLRHPQSEDRMKCRENMLNYIAELKSGKKTAHSANVVYPHELVKTLMEKRVNGDEESILQAQWNAIREETLRLGGLGKAVAMCDFSGSMMGLPMEISKALGILISETTHPAFRDHIITFDSKPYWHSFTSYTTLKHKVRSVDGRGQGLNTDFYRACTLIINKMVEHRVPVEEAPEDLIVITDMGFDDANNNKGNTEMLIQRIRLDFERAGERVWGKGNGWKAPRIVIWNVRAEYKDFHAKSDQEGVVELSGWSPSILKSLQKDGVKVKTPYEAMRATLDDPRYDKIREFWYDPSAHL